MARRKLSYSGGVKLREKRLKNGGSSLYLDIYYNQKRTYEFLNLHLENTDRSKQTDRETLALAEQIRGKRQIEIQSGAYGVVPVHRRKENFVAFFEAIVAGKKSTNLGWSHTLTHLKRFTKGVLPFSALTEQWCEEFRDYLLENVSENTAFLYFSKFKASLHKAVREKILLTNPASNVEGIKFRQSLRTYLTLDDLKRLAETPCFNAEIKRAFLFSCFCGLRLSDVQALTWKQVTEDWRIEIVQRKTQETLYIPLSAQAVEFLGKRGRHDEQPFTLPTRNAIGVALVKWSRDAGIQKHLSFHVSRHTYATLLLTQGADLYTVSKLLGHKDIRTTEIYAKIVDEKKRHAVDLLPRLDVLL